jgi:hypothetical protein
LNVFLIWQRLQIVPFIGDVVWVHVHFIQRGRFIVSQVSTFAPNIWSCLNKTNPISKSPSTHSSTCLSNYWTSTSLQASTITFVRLSGTSGNIRWTSEICWSIEEIYNQYLIWMYLICIYVIGNEKNIFWNYLIWN